MAALAFIRSSSFFFNCVFSLSFSDLNDTINCQKFERSIDTWQPTRVEMIFATETKKTKTQKKWKNETTILPSCFIQSFIIDFTAIFRTIGSGTLFGCKWTARSKAWSGWRFFTATLQRENSKNRNHNYRSTFKNRFIIVELCLFNKNFDHKNKNGFIWKHSYFVAFTFFRWNTKWTFWF